MDGFRVVRLEDVASTADIVITATGTVDHSNVHVHVHVLGTKHVVRREHMNKLKDGCILANMGHTTNEIDVSSLKDLNKEKIRPHVSHIIWPDGKAIILLADVRLLSPDCWIILLSLKSINDITRHI